MKTNILTILALFSLLVFNSCNNDPEDNNQNSLTKSEILNERKIDQSIDDVNEIVNGEFDFGFSARGNNPWLPACATVTSLQEGNTWIRTIDFGAEGCQLNNGNILKGKIIMMFTFDNESFSRLISITYENFTHNGRTINGTSTSSRTKSNANGNPESKLEVDLTTTLENGDIYSRKGFKMREWTEGSETNTKEDDVFLFTGNWTTVTPSKTISTNITKALKRIGTCKYFVEGIIEYTKGENTAVLDFGNGECDNKATLSINGETPEEITIDD